MSTKARVFISCGQATDEERDIASKIRTSLEKAGFATYVAVEEQILSGVKENIFRQLTQSEYFVFIDFRRESLSGTDKYRGSLFSNQELAIAAYREIDVVVFRENGVELNGISKYVQENAVEFSDRTSLPNDVCKKVNILGWDASWQNCLSMVDCKPSQTWARRVELHGLGNAIEYDALFFHIPVTNRHRDKPAINCYVYLERCRKLPDEEIKFNTIEFKWAGYVFPNAIIGPRSVRRFDAFYVGKELISVGAQSLLKFNVFSDSTEYFPMISKPGEYDFTFRVVSENFPPATATFRVKIPDNNAFGITISVLLPSNSSEK